MQKTTLWITRTAVCTALLIVFQAATAPLSNTLVTGSLVNLMLVLPTVLCGYPSGLAVAVLSPILAKLLGIGPLWELIPFIVLGNLTLVSVWQLAGQRKGRVARPLAVAGAAVCKFLVLYLGIVRFAVPVLLRLPQPQAGAVSALFSLPQLFTALLGGALACLLLPALERALGEAGARV